MQWKLISSRIRRSLNFFNFLQVFMHTDREVSWIIVKADEFDFSRNNELVKLIPLEENVQLTHLQGFTDRFRCCFRCLQ